MNPAGERRVLVCFSAGAGWWSRLLRRIMRCEINHTMVFYSGELWGGWWAVQVDEMGVRLVPALRAVSGVKKLLCYEYVGLGNMLNGLLSMRDYIGERYDWRGLAWGLIRTLADKVFGVEIRKPWHAYNRMFCSEFVATMLRNAKVPGTELWDTSSISPADLLTFVNHGDFEKVDWPS